MKFPVFQQLKDLKKGNVYIFLSDEDFFLEESKQVWRRLFGGGWNFEKLSSKEFGSISYSELMSAAGTSSLFGEGRALMVKNAAKLPKKRLTELSEINLLDNSSLKILLCVSTRRALQAGLKTFPVVEIDPLTSGDVVNWLKQNYDVRSEVARYIVESVGVELYPLYGEMEKLKTYVRQERQIEMKDVDVLILRSERYGPFELDDALLGKDYRKAVRVIESMLEEGVEPLQILGKLANLWRKLFASWQLVEQGKGSDIARVVGVHDFVASKLRKAVLGFSAEALVEGFGELVALDKALKTTAAKIHPQCSFNSMLWKMVGTRS